MVPGRATASGVFFRLRACGRGNDVHRHELANAAGSRGTGIGRGLHGAHVATHHHGDVARTDVLFANEHDVGRFHHRVCRFYGSDKTFGLDKPERFRCHVPADCNRFAMTRQRGYNADASRVYRQSIVLMMLKTLRGAVCLAVGILCLSSAAACRRNEPEPPPVATPSFSIPQTRVPAGSPVEVTYKFVVAQAAPKTPRELSRVRAFPRRRQRAFVD